MATVGVMNSTLMAIYVGGTLIGKSTSATLSVNHEPRDITTKDSNGWRELLEGLKSWSMSAAALYTVDEALGFAAMFSNITGRTKVTIRISSSVLGDKYYEGEAYVTSGDLNSAGQEENVAYDTSFEGTGPLIEGTVA